MYDSKNLNEEGDSMIFMRKKYQSKSSKKVFQLRVSNNKREHFE